MAYDLSSFGYSYWIKTANDKGRGVSEDVLSSQLRGACLLIGQICCDRILSPPTKYARPSKVLKLIYVSGVPYRTLPGKLRNGLSSQIFSNFSRVVAFFAAEVIITYQLRGLHRRRLFQSGELNDRLGSRGALLLIRISL